MSIKKRELITAFSRAICEGNAAIFAGAGLSRASGYVDWRELLKPLACAIDLNITEENDLISVAQYYRNARGNRGTINQTIIDEFTKDVQDNPNVEIITRLPIFTYWTTNYDTLIEDNIKRANRKPDVKSEYEQLANVIKDRDAIVYKMHGDVANPAHAVLTKYDYEMYEQRRPLFRTVLKGDLISKTFLFIGFSFEDPNLAYILSQIHTLLGEDIRDHYCFFRRVQRCDFKSDEAYGYAKAKQNYREEDLKKYGIQICFVDEYNEITEILHEIEKAILRKNIFISGSANEFSAPWSREAANYFASRLASALIEKDYKITSGFGLGIGSSIINGALDVIYSSKYRHIDEHLCLRPFPLEYSDPIEKKLRHTQYRTSMINENGIAIFIFGNKDVNGEIVNAEGCREEFELAVQNDLIVIPVGATGYMAKELLDFVKSNPKQFQYLQNHFDDLQNQSDIDELINLIITIVEDQQLI